MLVAQIMTREPVAVTPATPVSEAIQCMTAKDVHHLPVVDDAGDLVGVVTDRDLRRAVRMPILPVDDPAAVTLLAELTVEEVMTPEPLTTTPGAALVDAARLMQVYRIGCLPVLFQGRLVGIVTRTDLFNFFVNLLERRGGRLFWDY